MKAIYLDCFAGISGNMLLGAFLQMGVPQEHLEKELKKLITGDEFALHVSDADKNGIQAKYVDVEVKGLESEFESEADREAHGHTHEHIHGHEHCGHHHEHEHGHEHGHCPHHHEHAHEHGHEHHHDFGHTPEHLHRAHVHRSMEDIRRMIEDSELSDVVKKKSLAIFTCLAEAEGKVHGRPVDEVHFHEVGATDSIVDIVGTAICLEYLEVEKVFVSRVNTGSGFVKCAHGTMMVPAPATAELLAGFPFYHAADEKEMTTPTGAAVIHALAEFSENLPQDFIASAVAYGAGGWDLSIPNVLRIYLGEFRGTRGQSRFLLETNIDDMNPQNFGYIYDRLFEAGALDVWAMPIYMKKNRPAYTLSVLVESETKEACAEIMLQETTSIGIRVLPVAERIEAMRRTARVETPYGEVDCKISAYKGQIVSVSAEYDDCRRLAEEKKVPLKKVRFAALAELNRRLGE